MPKYQDNKIQSNNMSGVTGVCWDRNTFKWRVYISYKNKKLRLGNFKDFDLAVGVRQKAEIAVDHLSKLDVLDIYIYKEHGLTTQYLVGRFSAFQQDTPNGILITGATFNS